MGERPHVVQFSTGGASAEVLFRVAERFGVGNVLALTADTLVEDDDNWRFAREVIRKVGCRWIVLADGRTPMKVGRDRGIVPNNRMAACSQILKRELLRAWIDEHCDPEATVIYLGYDWWEQDRIDAAACHVTCADCRAGKCSEHIKRRCEWCDFYAVANDPSEAHVHPWQPYRFDVPLTWMPLLDKAEVKGSFHERHGIRLPRLYDLGFKHANCGGFCVRGGLAQWAHGLRVLPERYAEWEAAEEETRAGLGKDVAILRIRSGPRKGSPLSLREFREQQQSQPELFSVDEWGACSCF